MQKTDNAIRVCPERDGSCPHGFNCPFSIDRYHCDIEKSRAELLLQRKARANAKD